MTQSSAGACNSSLKDLPLPGRMYKFKSQLPSRPQGLLASLNPWVLQLLTREAWRGLKQMKLTRTELGPRQRRQRLSLSSTDHGLMTSWEWWTWILASFQTAHSFSPDLGKRSLSTCPCHSTANFVRMLKGTYFCPTGLQWISSRAFPSLC